MMATEVNRDFIMLSFAATECRRALDNLAEVEALAAVRIVREQGGEVRENLRAFDRIRLGLQMAANVSRIFWPPRNGERGAHLREITGLDEGHGLSDRRLRNHIEHIDERLDAWTETSPRPFLTIELVVHSDMPPPGDRRDEVKEMTAIVYDADDQTVHLFGDVFSLAELRTYLEDAGEKISEGISKVVATWG
ncbi:hypothetical protein [Erythrobacter colymbi]|uniref:hypothetical protein n=1 Tax=Erythrobacter colymbi TaxID=1161202 RepID=UPI00117BE535|nr:hypothetical protein [Erythrobacter colymbi]